jgi:hypothetical protein
LSANSQTGKAAGAVVESREQVYCPHPDRGGGLSAPARRHRPLARFFLPVEFEREKIRRAAVYPLAFFWRKPGRVSPSRKKALGLLKFTVTFTSRAVRLICLVRVFLFFKKNYLT